MADTRRHSMLIRAKLTAARHQVAYSTTLPFTKFKTRITQSDTYNQVAPGLFLGELLTKAQAEALITDAKPLGLVVSITQRFELEGVGTPLKIQNAKAWSNRNIEHLFLSVPDYSTKMEVTDVEKIVCRIREVILSGLNVYVHCKAGVGRSATLTACYLMEHGSGDHQLAPYASNDAIYQYLREQRPQVSCKKRNLNKLTEYRRYLHEKMTSTTPMPTVTVHDIERYLKSDEGLHAVMALDNALKLQQYKARHTHYFGSSHRSTQIQLFFDKFNLRDTTWLNNLYQETGPIKALLDARPGISAKLFSRFGHPKERRQILDAFKNELRDHLAKHFVQPCKSIDEALTSASPQQATPTHPSLAATPS